MCIRDRNSYLDMWITGGGNNHTGWSNAEYDQYITEDVYKRQPPGVPDTA